MNRSKFGKALAVTVVALALMTTWALLIWPAFPRAYAAMPYTGALNAMAGTGGTTVKTFVKIETEHATTPKIVTATASTDAVIGVCEQTSAVNVLAKYAPIGTQTTVTAGENVTVGNLVTAGTSGYAYVVDTDDATAQRICGLALATATTGNDLRMVVLSGYSRPGPTFLDGNTVVAADALPIPVTHGIVQKTTGADAEALTLANGTPGQLLSIVLAVDGGGDGTLTPTTKVGWATIVFADAGDRATLLYASDTLGWLIVGMAGIDGNTPLATQ